METNGCGACNGFWKVVNNIIPQRNFFKEECDRHDVLYLKGGSKKDRYRADLILYFDMKLKTKTYFYKRKWFSKQWYICIANLYYLGARLGGNRSFTYK